MIIWGSRTKRDGRGFVLKPCPRCIGEQIHFVAESKTKFTLYFVPTFTTSTKALLICTRCERQEEFNGPPAQGYLRAALPEHLMLAELRRRQLGSTGRKGSWTGSYTSQSASRTLAVGLVVLALQVALADGVIDEGEAVAVRHGVETIRSATKSPAVRDAAGIVLSDFEEIMAWIGSPTSGPLTLMLAQAGEVLSRSTAVDQYRYIGQLAWLCDKVITSHSGSDGVERDQMDAGFAMMGFDAQAVARALVFCERNGG